jgi:hypothetical protein
MSGAPDVARLIGDPLWFPHRYDENGDAFRFVHVPRAVHRSATFLTDEFLPGSDRPVPVDRAAAVAAAGPGAPIHFIFHSAYCCSTLLARAFDRAGSAMGLKEPIVLNDVAGWRRRGAEPRRVAMALDHSLRMLERPFGLGEKVIVKPSNVVNALAPAMLAMRPNAHAVLLYAPLPLYLASIAKKGMWGRLWVRELLQRQLEDGLVDYGFTAEDYLRQTDLQVAAVGWLAQDRLYRRLIDRFGPERVRTLNSETLVARPHDALGRLAALFGLEWDTATVAAIVAAEFKRHSKLGESYDAGDRRAEQSQAAAAHAEEIAMVAAWAGEVMTRNGQSVELGCSLLD